jgi:hypothetical protein
VISKSDDSSAEGKAPRLLDQVRSAIARRHYSQRTEETYIHWIKRFIYFHSKRHPREMGQGEVTAFLNHLARRLGVAAATQNQALAAILFLYKEVLNQPLPWLDRLERASRPARVPTVLSVPEVQRLPGQHAGREVADGQPSVRCGIAPAGMPEIAGEGRGLRLPADPGARRQRREGPRHRAA